MLQILFIVKIVVAERKCLDFSLPFDLHTYMYTYMHIYLCVDVYVYICMKLLSTHLF